MVINYDMVDLGLPSGLKWTKCNLGAEKETDYGLYFQWSETKGYTWEEIKNCEKKVVKINEPYYDESTHTYIKYNPRFDKKVILDKYDDPISKYMGLSYRMPTKEDFNELLNYTINEWVTINGVSGRKFTSEKDSTKYIFIPASGNANVGSMNNVGSSLNVWSSTLNTSNPYYTWYLFGCPTTCDIYYNHRWFGFSLRAVSN